MAEYIKRSAVFEQFDNAEQGLQALSQLPKRFVLPTYGAKDKCPRVFRRCGVCRAGRLLLLRREKGRRRCRRVTRSGSGL